MKKPLVYALFAWTSYLALLVSCSKPPGQTPGAVALAPGGPSSKQTLTSFTFSQGIPLVITPDPAYAFADPAWVRGAFAAKLGEEQTARGLGQYENPANDCIRFSRLGVQVATEMFYKNVHPPGCALAVGVFLYVRADGEGHCINCFVVRSVDGTLSWLFFEPQTRQQVPLSEVEIRRGMPIF